jgi:glutamine amidotransferase
MDEAVKAFANSGKPLLGICLGMQLLFNSSVEFGKRRLAGILIKINYRKLPDKKIRLFK